MVDALEARDVKRLQKIIAAHVGQDISERGRESRPHSLIRRAGPDRHAAAIRQRIAAVVLFGRPSCAPGRRASGILPMAS